MKVNKFIKIIILFSILLIIGSVCLIKNKSDYEKITDDFNNLSYWDIFDYEKDYLNNKGSEVSIVDNGYDGKAVLISGDVLNDTRLHKLIEVEPNSYYKLSVMAKAMASEEGNGASISALYCNESYNIANSYDTWQEHIVYIATDKEQNQIDFSLGLGGHSAVSMGYVYYDNFSLEKIEKVPKGENTITFKSFNESSTETENNTKNAWISKIIFVVLVLALFIYSVSIMKKNSKEPITKTKYKLDKIDYLTMLALTLICAIISFYKLGDNYAASSFWKSGTSGEYVIIELEEPTTINRVAHYGNVPNNGYYKISYSIDGENYIDAITLGEFEELNSQTALKKAKSGFFQWKYDDTIFKGKFIKIESMEPGWGINEMAFFKLNEKNEYEKILFEINDIYYKENSVGTPAMLFDEQDLVPLIRDYMNGTYFDEVYFPRTAYEQLNGLSIYETTHPPFGKILISIGIAIFGMNPFGWRIMGTIFGILLVPLMYLFAIKIFKNRKYAFIATFLIMFDFMRFSHSRLATIDSFSTFFVLAMYFFMFDYFVNKEESILYDKKDKEQKKKFMLSIKPLFLCGLMFGFGAATKWSCVYAGAGLAFVFFMKKFSEYWKIRKAKRLVNKWFIYDFVPTCLWCVIFFILIPLTIYTLSYITYMPSEPYQSLIEITIDNQKLMFDYHSNLVGDHPYGSRWWSWPIDMVPLWSWANYSLPEGQYATIASFGNPAVWIPSALAVLVSLYFIFRDKDKRGLLLLIAYAFQYLPWILPTRSTFIYAYFIPLPFSILLLVYCMEKLNKGKKLTKTLLIIYLLIVLALFIIFFPVISGMTMSKEYIESLKWFSTWTF